MAKEIEINGKKFTINEIKYKEIVKLSEAPKNEMAKSLLILSTEMTEEEYDNLSMKEGIELQKLVNELNGLVDFQQPSMIAD